MLLQDLKDRFSFITDQDHPKYDPICLIAQALDPRYALLLDYQEKAAVKYQLSVMVKHPLPIILLHLSDIKFRKVLKL